MHSVWMAARDVTVCRCNKGNAASKCSDGTSCLVHVDGFDSRRDGDLAGDCVQYLRGLKGHIRILQIARRPSLPGRLR